MPFLNSDSRTSNMTCAPTNTAEQAVKKNKKPVHTLC